MSALPYMPLYVADYMADAAHLTTEEHGAYLLLIMTYWQRGKALPSDPARLANVVRMSSERWASVQQTLSEFFDCVDGEWRHKRIEAELAKVRDKSAKAKRAGKASGESRKQTDVQRTFNGRSTDAQRTLNHTDTDTDTEIVTPPVVPPHPVEAAQPDRKRDSKRGSRLPADWTLPSDLRAWAQINFSSDDAAIDLEADRFRDFWIAKPGSAGCKLDWHATWRNWCRNVRQPATMVARHPASQPSQAMAALDRLRAKYAAEGAAS